MKDIINELFDQYEHNKKVAAEAGERIKGLEKALTALKKDREKAAEDGNIDEYERLNREIEKQEGRIYVAMKSGSKNAGKPITPELVAESWRKHSAEYRKSAEGSYNAYLKDVEKLASKYEKLVGDQNEELKLRERLAEIVGKDPGELELGWSLPNEHKSSFNYGHKMHAPELQYFGLLDVWKEHYGNGWSGREWPAYDTLWSVVVQGKSVQDCNF